MEALTVRGHSQNKKCEKGGKVRSKSRVGKDECAFCHEKRHWKKDCHKLKKKDKDKAIYDVCVIECRCNSRDSEFCLVGHQIISSFDEFWIQVAPIIYVHIRNGSSILMKLMVELFIWVVVILAI